ncbi:hypothetical protein PENARI_c003G02025 [Penicillium arizonense]|uniref:Uncharacterized protein n=1 Tax=Penicillium arizonense TaxID=1835702 RepID=A0A1F5LTZ8_PENAI|nr:hypothetical protein PENARI_c003G02025 [Penicillium arizonense]OGE56665.1 hypothetical protein PENARI_c003G02025 [Penicillium arizonense]
MTNAGCFSSQLAKTMIGLQSGLGSLLGLQSFAIQSSQSDNMLNVPLIGILATKDPYTNILGWTWKALTKKKCLMMRNQMWKNSGVQREGKSKAGSKIRINFHKYKF